MITLWQLLLIRITRVTINHIDKNNRSKDKPTNSLHTLILDCFYSKTVHKYHCLQAIDPPSPSHSQESPLSSTSFVLLSHLSLHCHPFLPLSLPFSLPYPCSALSQFCLHPLPKCCHFTHHYPSPPQRLDPWLPIPFAS